MSNPYSDAYQNPPPSQIPLLPPNQSNPIGTAGFVVSLIGLLTCGFLSIFGLGLSLFGLGKNPKGLAIAGVVMGLIGLVELALVGLIWYSTMQAFGDIQVLMQEFEDERLAQEIASDIADEWELTKQLPGEAEGQTFVDNKTTFNGNEFRYETDGSSFTIRGTGQDQEFDTEDDITAGPFNSAQEVFDLVAEEDFDFEYDPELEEFEGDVEEEIEGLMDEDDSDVVQEIGSAGEVEGDD